MNETKIAVDQFLNSTSTNTNSTSTLENITKTVTETITKTVTSGAETTEIFLDNIPIEYQIIGIGGILSLIGLIVFVEYKRAD